MKRHLLSRRHFTGLLGGAAFAASSKPGRSLNIGVGTFSYHNLSIDDMIVQLIRLNIREIEMSRGEFMLMKPPTSEMCQAARDKFDKAGIRCVSYYTATIKDERDLDYAVRFAKILGARNVSGDATGGMLKLIDQRFSQEGLTFGIHNHWFKHKFAYESANDVLNGLAGLSKTCGATLDVGQMAACGHDPIEAIQKLAKRLLVVHLKDVQSAGAEHNVLFGHGVARIPEVMKELRAINFGGLVAIEYEKDGDANDDMESLVRYARSLNR